MQIIDINGFMPIRNDVFINNGIYHIYNRTIFPFKSFQKLGLRKSFLERLIYYRSCKSNLRYSTFKNLEPHFKKVKEKELSCRTYFRVEVLAYCLMPNHYHFILKQLASEGIKQFMSNSLNAFTRYYNILYNRKGPLFLPQFKSKVITSREQLIHTSRYIHLNPYSSGIVNEYEDLLVNLTTSLNEYVYDLESTFCNTDIILSEFNHDRSKYKYFVLDNLDYQRTLEIIKHSHFS